VDLCGCCGGEDGSDGKKSWGEDGSRLRRGGSGTGAAGPARLDPGPVMRAFFFLFFLIFINHGGQVPR